MKRFILLYPFYLLIFPFRIAGIWCAPPAVTAPEARYILTRFQVCQSHIKINNHSHSHPYLGTILLPISKHVFGLLHENAVAGNQPTWENVNVPPKTAPWHKLMLLQPLHRNKSTNSTTRLFVYFYFLTRLSKETDFRNWQVVRYVFNWLCINGNSLAQVKFCPELSLYQSVMSQWHCSSLFYKG